MHVGLGAWFRNASPAQRQLIFDPNETEVEYYHYTENNGRFDPEGKETVEADVRHRNVPDNLAMIPPLIMSRYSTTSAQLARWRGWSEVLFDGAYSSMLITTETYMNNILDPQFLSCNWRAQEAGFFTKASGVSVTKEELSKIAKCWYPVHAMGYNFLKSNADSARIIAERIKGVVEGYKNCGFSCNEVIIVTHSMGGLVGRALIHPKYGNLLNCPDVRVLGIYHGAMPTLGAAATYKRVRFGFQEKDNFKDNIFAEIVGKNGEHATAILANTFAPLEMLPSRGYGPGWLKVIDSNNRVLFSWPNKESTAFESIYQQPSINWWRLINPAWINPAGQTDANGAGIKNVKARLYDANAFLDSIEKTFHPTHSYASFCASTEHQCFGEVVFKIMNMECYGSDSLPPADSWKLISDDKLGTLKVQAGNRILTLKLQPGTEAGDGTVPSERSAGKIVGTRFKHGTIEKTGYEHQDSYSHSHVLASMLYSIVKMAGTAKWD